LFILTILFPVVLRGRSFERRLALFLAIFPLSLLLFTLVGLLFLRATVRS
jgi:hypothetical protein